MPEYKTITVSQGVRTRRECVECEALWNYETTASGIDGGLVNVVDDILDTNQPDEKAASKEMRRMRRRLVKDSNLSSIVCPRCDGLSISAVQHLFPDGYSVGLAQWAHEQHRAYQPCTVGGAMLLIAACTMGRRLSFRIGQR